jgi:hypothetical protein
MGMRKETGVFLIVFMSFLLSGVPLPALETLELDGGLFIITSTDPDSAPSPILPAVGVTLPFQRKLGIFDVEASFLLSGTFYQYANDRASPAELDFRDYVVPCILADIRGSYTFLRREAFSLGADAGLAAFLRIPIPLPKSPNASENFGKTLSYLYVLRFLYPETGIFGTYRILENMDLKLSVRACWPLYLLWSPDDPAFPEGLLASVLIGIIWKLPPKES